MAATSGELESHWEFYKDMMDAKGAVSNFDGDVAKNREPYESPERCTNPLMRFFNSPADWA